MSKELDIIEYGLTDKERQKLELEFKNYMVNLQRDFEFKEIAKVFDQFAFIWAKDSSLERLYGLEECKDYVPVDSTMICPKESYIRSYIDQRLNFAFNALVRNAEVLRLNNLNGTLYSAKHKTDSGRFVVSVEVFLDKTTGELWLECDVEFIAFEYGY